MVTPQDGFFDDCFHALTGNAPFPWQQELFRRFIAGKTPNACSIPTGLGKTAVIAIWLIALAYYVKSKGASARIPRRLVYVVNRRTVVDQSTSETERMRDRLTGKGELSDKDRAAVDELKRLLAELCAGDHDEVLAISTLRGQFADNGEWHANPARPAVIVGTVDMIGSRLLFSGYRVGFKGKPLHAGFLGQDVLLVHDESHLEPAFQTLIERIQREQNELERTAEVPWPKLRVMALSATARNGDEGGQPEEREPFMLTDRERDPPPVIPDPPTEPIHYVWRRLKAEKALAFHSVGPDKGAVAKRIAAIAASYKDTRNAVLVFVRTLDDVDSVKKELEKTKQSALPLTGTMRGKERDDLPANPVFKRFLKGAEPGGTVYLVCTSAGEVGVDLSADHLVCDLSTFESMAQRFGRVNRFGSGHARIDVVYSAEFDESDKRSTARENALKLLECLPELPEREDEPGVRCLDASPKALADLREHTDLPCRIEDAFAPAPAILPVTEILFDAWAMTTIREQMPGQPEVALYLHGIAEREPPETYVAWRQEVGIITDELLDRYDPEDLLDDYPLKPHELLRDRSDRVFGKLQMLAARHPDLPVWVMDERGKVTPSPLGQLADPSATNSAGKKPLITLIEGQTVLLPPTAGGLSQGGMLDGTSNLADDVADIEEPPTERRMRPMPDEEKDVGKDVEMRLVRSIELNQDDDDSEDNPTWNWYKCRSVEDSRTAHKPVLWDVHSGDALQHIDHILAGLSLPEELAHAVRVAVKLHDRGKWRPQYQFALGNTAYPDIVLAKSGRRGARATETYRHEFGSLADVAEEVEFRQLSPEMQDVVLHLIAAHHGRARPHFLREEAFDPLSRGSQTAGQLASEVPRRFARLQRKYGRWGLAYLESLLRAADWAASAEPSQFVTEAKEVSQ